MKPETNDRQFKATAPHFVVRSLKESVEYYHRALGFSMPQLWGDPPEFAMPSREGFIFMLKQAAEGVDVVTSRDQSGVWDAYIWINDADSLVSKFKEDGAIIEYEPCIPFGTKRALARVILTRVERLLSPPVDSTTADRVETS